MASASTFNVWLAVVVLNRRKHLYDGKSDGNYPVRVTLAIVDPGDMYGAWLVPAVRPDGDSQHGCGRHARETGRRDESLGCIAAGHLDEDVGARAAVQDEAEFVPGLTGL